MHYFSSAALITALLFEKEKPWQLKLKMPVADPACSRVVYDMRAHLGVLFASCMLLKVASKWNFDFQVALLSRLGAGFHEVFYMMIASKLYTVLSPKVLWS